MGRRQQHIYRLDTARFPPDFPVRLDEFRQAAGLSWRELARLLHVNVRSVHRWRNGATPDAARLLVLLELAAECDLLSLLLPCAAQHTGQDQELSN
ncbi:MAG: helix-turn-helix transcriptional regulator [Chloroflexi bacterium]|nr:helix-turn-helix transcriptional regulator [Chloroflexota bacterium]